MRATLSAFVLAGIAGLAISAPAAAQGQSSRGAAKQTVMADGSRPVDELPIRRLTLYRSGVASFERRGLVDGNTHVQLKFETDAVNDILKSMIVLDLSKKGQIAGVSYGSKEPLARRLASFGVDISDQPPLGTILARLRGTRLTVTLPEGPVSGTILGGEMRQEARQGAQQLVSVPYINLLTANGIRSINLTQAITVALEDPDLNGELARALAAVDEQRAERIKTVDVNLVGDGAREIVIAYVQEAPVWKTSYRLVLPDEPSGAKPDPKAAAPSATIQAWAIVENTTDEDWKDIRLSLVAGRPVSFTMDLYEPLFAARPGVPVPTIPGATPRTYAESTAALRAPGSPQAPAVSDRPLDAPARAYREERAKSLGVEMDRARGGSGQSPFRDASAAPEPLSAEDLANYAAASQAHAVESGEVFQFELTTPVSIERQRSAMLPILSAGVQARRVSIYNAADGLDHPMRGVEMVNTSDQQLIPGPITVFDGGVYAGDAQIGHVPRADRRLLAYAVDLDVNARLDYDSTRQVRKARIVKGLLELTVRNVAKTTYTFTNKDQSRPRTLVVEHPRDRGSTLVEPKAPADQTDDLYRFEVAIPAAGNAPLSVVQERVEATSYQLTTIDLPTLLSYRTSGAASEAVVNAFKEAARRQGVLADIQKSIEQLEKERGTISEDQNRIRQNMTSIDRTSQLYTRYMQKLTDQESRLEQIATDLARQREEQARAQNDLNAYLSELSVE